jgi:hypothetical protein
VFLLDSLVVIFWGLLIILLFVAAIFLAAVDLVTSRHKLQLLSKYFRDSIYRPFEYYKSVKFVEGGRGFIKFDTDGPTNANLGFCSHLYLPHLSYARSHHDFLSERGKNS